MLIPALATWHERHGPAEYATRDVDVAVGHSIVETYSVLTRMPDPLRSPPSEVARAIETAISHVLVLDAAAARDLPTSLSTAGIGGGATYDGLIAVTALLHGATLVTMDRRAVRTYEALGADYELIT